MHSELAKLNSGAPAEGSGALLRGGTSLKWAGILCFTAAPFVCVSIVLATLPAPLADPVEMAEGFQRRELVDTIVLGDSRVCTVVEEPFAARGWHFYNLGLSGVSPEDMAMSLKYALMHGRVRRVVMGVSFEGMSARFPFEFSRYLGIGPFAAPRLSGLPTSARHRPIRPHRGWLRVFLRDDPLLDQEANARLRHCLPKCSNTAPGRRSSQRHAGLHRPRGGQIAAGELRLPPRNATCHITTTRPTERPAFLQEPRLSESGQQLYRKVFAAPARSEDLLCRLRDRDGRGSISSASTPIRD